MSITAQLITATDQLALELLARSLSAKLKNARQNEQAERTLDSLRRTWPKEFDNPALLDLLDAQRRSRTWPGVGAYMTGVLRRSNPQPAPTAFSHCFRQMSAQSQPSGSGSKVAMRFDADIEVFAWWNPEAQPAAPRLTWTLSKLSVVFPANSNKLYNGNVVFIFERSSFEGLIKQIPRLEEELTPEVASRAYA